MIILDRLFQDHMILQRGKPVPVRGSASPRDTLAVEIQGQTVSARADETGAWSALLGPLSASDAETLTVTAVGPGGLPDGEEPESVTISDVAVGEVWVAGGQSNMEFWMRYERHRADEGRSCPRPRLRFYDVPKVCYDGQLEEFDYSRMGVWRVATDDDLDYFSAVAYYFQKELSEDLDVPVGIIGCNWGGTVSAAWMSAGTVSRVGQPWTDWFAAVPEYQDFPAYLAAQHGKPVNDHGNPFGDYFLEHVLPRTLSTEEAMKFLVGLPPETFEIFDDYMNHPQPQSIPGSLYEHMVKPIAFFPVRGVLWYQGEGDDEFGLAAHYQVMLQALIEDWRALWGCDLPFLIVQIPGFSQWLLSEPGNNLMEIRRCQECVCDAVPGAYLCSASDAGEETEAHPKDKVSIGHGLALLARHYVYGEDLLCDAPRAVGAERDGSRLTLTFENAGDGLSIEGEGLAALTVTAGDTKLSVAEASAKGNRLTVTLTAPSGAEEPLTVSFARTSYYRVNLYNSAGIPAIPFEMTV